MRIWGCGFRCSVLLQLEGRESFGGGRNANLSHLLVVGSAYQRRGEERRDH